MWGGVWVGVWGHWGVCRGCLFVFLSVFLGDLLDVGGGQVNH